MAAFIANAVSYVAHMFDSPYNPARVDMPMDPEEPCYSLSFTKDQIKEYKEFFDMYGYVVVRDVLSTDDCLATIDDIWSYIENRGFDWKRRDEEITNPIRRDDPSTWDNGWPPGQSEGLVGNRPIFTKRAQENRQNSDVYNVFANLLGEKELMVSQDRYGLFRPTADQNGKTVHEEWKTFANVHMDLNPWVYTLPRGEGKELNLDSLTYAESNDYFEENNHPGRYQDRKDMSKVLNTIDEEPKMADEFQQDTESNRMGGDIRVQVHAQGLINLADNRPEDGGLVVVPGFHKIFPQWTEHTRNTLGKQYSNKMTFILLDENDPVWSHAQRVSARAGSLVVWNQLVAHGSAPNYSPRARYAQFLKYQNAVPLDSKRGQRRQQAIAKQLEKFGVDVTDLGSKLLSQKSW